MTTPIYELRGSENLPKKKSEIYYNDDVPNGSQEYFNECVERIEKLSLLIKEEELYQCLRNINIIDTDYISNNDLKLIVKSLSSTLKDWLVIERVK